MMVMGGGGGTAEITCPHKVLQLDNNGPMNMYNEYCPIVHAVIRCAASTTSDIVCQISLTSVLSESLSQH